MKDLYSLPMSGVFWSKCGGNTDDSGSEEACALIAEIPGSPGAVAIQDTKKPGVELRFDAAETKSMTARLVRMSAA